MWAAWEERVAPQSLSTRECWYLEHVVVDLFSHTKTGKIQWFLFQSSLSLSCECHSRCASLVATWNATVATGGLHGASAAEARTRHVC